MVLSDGKELVDCVRTRPVDCMSDVTVGALAVDAAKLIVSHENVFSV